MHPSSWPLSHPSIVEKKMVLIPVRSSHAIDHVYRCTQRFDSDGQRGRYRATLAGLAGFDDTPFLTRSKERALPLPTHVFLFGTTFPSALVLLLSLLFPSPFPSCRLMCAFQTINDWYDREIDAINEPYRPIPSGAISEVSQSMRSGSRVT